MQRGLGRCHTKYKFWPFYLARWNYIVCFVPREWQCAETLTNNCEVAQRYLNQLLSYHSWSLTVRHKYLPFARGWIYLLVVFRVILGECSWKWPLHCWQGKWNDRFATWSFLSFGWTGRYLSLGVISGHAALKVKWIGECQILGRCSCADVRFGRCGI